VSYRQVTVTIAGDTSRILGDTSRAVQAVLNNSVVSVANTLNGEPSAITSSNIPLDFLKHDQRKLITGKLSLFTKNLEEAIGSYDVSSHRILDTVRLSNGYATGNG
jgi:hypothetical protein